MVINKERLADLFTTLCEIDSPSGKEGTLAAYLTTLFTEMGASVFEDDSAPVTGSDCGNLLVRFVDGGLDLEPVFFNCHLDTVQPGEGVAVVREGDRFSSRGETVLGADDKSGIAVLIEVIRALRENKIPHGPVEFIFTTGEEIGLLGVKALDCSRLIAKMGYALDTTETNSVIIGAPAANRYTAEICGVSAHAGLNPEQGINAIQLAARAVAELHLGRIDRESTANVGLIKGGVATNIIPGKAVVMGEIRSHSEATLNALTEEVKETFYQVVDDWSGHCDKAAGKSGVAVTVVQEYPVMKLARDAPVIQRAARAGRDLAFRTAGGGSDANILTSKGYDCAIIGTGMTKVHTTDETIELADMIRCAGLVMGILTTG
ncbi:MAG: M20/M25/M40 family metallo-hydrolase [Desulfobacterales bacterium]|nr:M20/M25/M40 family metallo-hydrolase [Desulfobacterales bacterium]